LPRFRIRQVATQVSIKDGQTVVLGGMPATIRQQIKDASGKVTAREERKNLLIFVTAYQIDPAGNRIHPPE
jgi:hypothetical protein